MPGALTTKSQPEGQGYVKLLLASVGWNLQCMAFNECVSWLQLVDGRTPLCILGYYHGDVGGTEDSTSLNLRIVRKNLAMRAMVSLYQSESSIITWMALRK